MNFLLSADSDTIDRTEAKLGIACVLKAPVRCLAERNSNYIDEDQEALDQVESLSIILLEPLSVPITQASMSN